MASIAHLAALIVGFSAYYFSDVHSDSAFYNIFLPLVALVSFLYGITVVINILYKLRHPKDDNVKSNDILLASLKEHGLLNKGQDVAAMLQASSSTASSVDNIEGSVEFDNIVVVEPNQENQGQEDQSLEALSQQDQNEQEWQNPDNWSGSVFFAVYFSKRDSRTWVSKQNPLLGYTLNLGKVAAVYWLYGLWLSVLVLSITFLALI